MVSEMQVKLFLFVCWYSANCCGPTVAKLAERDGGQIGGDGGFHRIKHLTTILVEAGSERRGRWWIESHSEEFLDLSKGLTIISSY